MDAEKSSNSSFEDLSNLNEAEVVKSGGGRNVISGKSPYTVLDDEGNVELAPSTSSLDSENSNFVSKTSYSFIENQSDKVKALTSELIDSERGPMGGGQKEKEEASTEIPRAHENNADNAEAENDVDVDDDKDNGNEKDDTICDVLGNGQLVKTIIRRAPTQNRPKRCDLVTVNYVGKLRDGTIVEEVQNFQLHVGDYEVVQGLDMVIPLMDLHEVAKVEVHPRFAYGSLGLKNEKEVEKSIPPNEEIVYEVELLDIKEEDFSDLRSYEVRRKYGTRKKERANFWYNRSEYNIAIQLYRRALDFLDDRDGDPNAAFDKEDLELSNKELQTLLDDRLIVYNNMAMAQIKVAAFDAALKSVENVLRCQPNNSKALYRKGRVLDGKGDVKGAISLLQKAATFEPESKIIQQDLAKLIIKARREEHNEKELYQKMLGQAKKLEMKNKQPPKQETTQGSKAKFIGFLMGSILIGVAGVAIYRYKY